MIEINSGTIEEQIIKILRKSYPVTIKDIEKKLHISREKILRTLQKFQIKGIVQLEPLPDKIFVRLKRNDFKFIGKKRQKKFVKHRSGPKKYQTEDYDGIMYS
jgi:predicted ArsR family transcriptional regulator